VHDLRQLLDAKNVKYDDCRDKDELVGRAIEQGLTGEQPPTGQGEGAGASA
jgi:hypothetical protein